MKKLNLFWPVYKNLEREVLHLAEYIHFSDDQLAVYSMHIADLIVRCAVEIEALSKEIYFSMVDNNSRDQNEKGIRFDTDCLDLMEKKWRIGRKKVIVSSMNMYFSEEKSILYPLRDSNLRGSEGSQWKQAYMALKHDRHNSIKQATIENLLSALAALFVLNIYYKDDEISIARCSGDNISDLDLGSEIFTVYQYHANFFHVSVNMNDDGIQPFINDDLDSSVIILKCKNEDYQKLHEYWCSDLQQAKSKYDSLSSYEKERSRSYSDELMVRFYSDKKSYDYRSWSQLVYRPNKHSQIYPDLVGDKSDKEHDGIGMCIGLSR